MPITTAQAAQELGISPRRVLALIEAGRLPAEWFGSNYSIKPEDLDLVRDRKVGRPRKPSPPEPAKKLASKRKSK